MPDLSLAVPLPERRVEIGVSLECAPSIAVALRPFVPDIAAQAARRIEVELPELARPGDPERTALIARGVGDGIGHFLDLLAEPGIGAGEMVAFWRRVGAQEAEAGRTLDAWHAAARIAAGVALEGLTAAAQGLGHRVSAATVASFAHAVFDYLNQLSTLLTEGHNEAKAQAAGSLQDRRRHLLDLLLARSGPGVTELREAARDASWALPRTAAVVALSPRGPGTRPPTLSADILPGLHLPEPCLIVPDPDGPGRHQLWERRLRGWSAAVGPTVEVTELAKSLRLSRDALELAAQGLIDDSAPIAVEMHMPIIVMMRERELVERVIERRLAPLLGVRPPHRHRLAETLLVSLECGFNATEVAGRLHLHAQTVRYRLRRLSDLFGETMYATTGRLELHMALQAWLALNAEPADDRRLRTG
ncbi:PucR family transcriptional regulator [Actinomadura flavalba]|uniref:PucR family transcriptional regulator n=1 Tax=Actinomadura flavalba TaxID=1120938 RepID=UPI00036574C1|nr:helix-turn-helix domain-containing protein [Actinomadura flavalba]